MLKIGNKTVWKLVLFYFLWNKCFNFYLFAETAKYNEFKEIIVAVSFACLFPYILKQQRKHVVSSYVFKLLIIFSFSFITAFLFWGQGFYATMRALCGGFYPIIVFFVLQKMNVSVENIIKSVVVICVIYAFCQILGSITFPNHIFGKAGKAAIEKSMSDFEERGLLRLAIPGADFIVMAIFIAVTYCKRNVHKLLLFIIPLVILLLMRGTRTPFFVTLFIGMVYFLFGMKNKLLAFVLGIVLFSSAYIGYDALLNSKSQNAFVSYLQLTNNQMEMGDENIRVRMSEYFLYSFNNGNLQKIIFGNGVPGFSNYGSRMMYLGEYYHFWAVDVGLVEMFVYFGLLGVLFYIIFFVKLIRLKVTPDCFFAKLMLLYYYVILPFNNMLLANPIIVAVVFYVLYVGNIRSKILMSSRTIAYDRNS